MLTTIQTHTSTHNHSLLIKTTLVLT